MSVSEQMTPPSCPLLHATSVSRLNIKAICSCIGILHIKVTWPWDLSIFIMKTQLLAIRRLYIECPSMQWIYCSSMRTILIGYPANKLAFIQGWLSIQLFGIHEYFECKYPSIARSQWKVVLPYVWTELASQVAPAAEEATLIHIAVAKSKEVLLAHFVHEFDILCNCISSYNFESSEWHISDSGYCSTCI